MRNPNPFFGNGPGNGDDTQSQRDLEAYNRNRLQMTVATSTFAGVALVGMFCSCLWFVCCRNSSSKTRKKRTWAATSTDGALHNNPYSYDGYLDAQGYMQMNTTMDGVPDAGGVAPYISNPLYHPSSLYPSDNNGLHSTYDFNERYGFSHGDKGPMISLTNDGTLLKDVPPSYTALFFAASDPYSGIRGTKGVAAGKEDESGNFSSDPRVTSIQPIHLKVTSNTNDQLKTEKGTLDTGAEQYQSWADTDDEEDGHLKNFKNFPKKEDPTTAPPVSLLSVESDPEKKPDGDEQEDQASNQGIPEHKTGEGNVDNPPPYNPGFKGYKRF